MNDSNDMDNRLRTIINEKIVEWDRMMTEALDYPVPWTIWHANYYERCHLARMVLSELLELADDDDRLE